MSMSLMDDQTNIPILPNIALGRYRHYKGNEYEIIGVGAHTESLEPHVVYRSLAEKSYNKIWIRPYLMFIESVEFEGKTIPRFTKIAD